MLIMIRFFKKITNVLNILSKKLLPSIDLIKLTY